MKNFIKEFREYSKDNQEPYFFTEKEIQSNVEVALKLYSRKKPILREGKIVIVEGQKMYALPEVFFFIKSLLFLLIFPHFYTLKFLILYLLYYISKIFRAILEP